MDKNEEDPIKKIKALEWSQQYSLIFQMHAQGQLTQ